MFSNRLIDELGLLRLVSKQVHQAQRNNETPQSNQAVSAVVDPEPEATEKLDKNEFRLLVKMLQAINHECQYDHIDYDGSMVKYRLHNKTLIFNDINQTDDANTMNLSSLHDLINQPELKRPVWEKLKTLMP